MGATDDYRKAHVEEPDVGPSLAALIKDLSRSKGDQPHQHERASGAMNLHWDKRYRRLAEGEIIQEGDECLTDTHLGWQPANCIGQAAPSPLYTSHRVYRRLKSA